MAKASNEQIFRGVLAVFEAAQPNSAQRDAITQVRVLLGDIPAPGCAHDMTFTHYDSDNNLICDRCDTVLETAETAAPTSANQEPSQED